MLKNAQKALEEVPEDIQFSEGFHFMLNNNLAQLANKMGSVDTSVQYLEQAVQSSEDPRMRNKDELPLAETFLNIANAHAFLNRHELSITYA